MFKEGSTTREVMIRIFEKIVTNKFDNNMAEKMNDDVESLQKIFSHKIKSPDALSNSIS